MASCTATKRQSRIFQKITGVAITTVITDSSVYKTQGDNIDSSLLDFFYNDSGVTGSVHSFSLKENSNASLLITSPTFIYKNDNTARIFYAYPKCHLKVIQNREGSIELIDLNGNPEKNNELNFFQKLIEETGRFNIDFQASYRPLDSVNDIAKLIKLESGIFQLKCKRLMFLDSIATNSQLSFAFITIAKNVIQNVSINDSLVLYFNFKNILLEKNLYHFKLLSILKNVNAINSRPTYYFLETCLTLLNLLEEKDPEKISIGSIQKFYESIDTVIKKFNGLARDILLTNKYVLACKKYQLSDNYYKYILENITDANFKVILEDDNEKYYAKLNFDFQSKGNDVITLNDRKGSIDGLLASHKGKIIFLDFWASWCKPCLENMRHSQLLEQYYKSKNIVFLYISIDQNLRKWKVSSLSNIRTNGNSFKLVDFNKSEFVKKYKIIGIPHYMIIDKSGIIINDNAPSPGDLKLKELIDKLLKQSKLNTYSEAEANK